MKSLMKLAAVAVASLGIAACGDRFLTGPKLTENPNSPTIATANQRLVAVQALMFTRLEGDLARVAGMLTQQFSGTNNQQKDRGSSYQIFENDVGNFMPAFYTGGGLANLRVIMDLAQASGDEQLEGIAKVWEAYAIGTVASLWGDVPYSQAVNVAFPTPILDDQEDVYARVQLVLDTAITLLAGAGPGPGAADVIYGGNTGRWIRAARTLKARYHMHTFEVLGNAALNAAITQALLGINEAPTTVAQAVHGQAVGDFRSLHGNDLQTGNIWGQFLRNRQDMTAGATLVNLLNGRAGDPRLAGYFDVVGGVYVGSSQWGIPPGTGASLLDTETRFAFTFRQPFITWTENQLILAEAYERLGQDANAETAVNAVRTALGMTTITNPTLAQIQEEKYIAMFQNIEVWNDFKRNCYPALVPAGPTLNVSDPAIPGRIPYPFAERQANPNIPAVNAQPARNWNDPNACT